MKYLFWIFLGFGVLANQAEAQQYNPCEYSCNSECRRYQMRLENELYRIQTKCGGGPVIPTPTTASVVLYKSDSCSSDLVGRVTPETNCDTYASSRVWGIKINDKCHDISDVSGNVACETFKGAGSPDAVYLYRSDSCTNNLLAIVDYRTDCQKLSTLINSSVWGIRYGESSQCEDIADTKFYDACERFKQ